MITGNFTGLGESEVKRIKSADLSITGTFVGTIVLKRNGVVMETFTEPSQRVIQNAGHQLMSLECTAYSSGQIDYVFG